MKKTGIIDPEYLQWIKELSLRYRRGQIKAAVKVNQEMLRYYWDLGKDIVQRDAENKYGSGFFNVLSRDLKASLGLSKGFSPTTLKYAKYFYCLYSQALENRQQVADDLVAVFFASTVILNVVYQANAHKCQDHSNYAFHNTSFFKKAGRTKSPACLQPLTQTLSNTVQRYGEDLTGYVKMKIFRKSPKIVDCTDDSRIVNK